MAVLRVSQYNGLLTDDQVTVDAFVATAPKLADPNAAAMQLDGADPGYVLRESVADELEVGDPVGDAQSRYRTETAYVTENRLVARIPDMLIPSANVYFKVHEVVLVAQINREKLGDDSRVALREGMMAGVNWNDELIQFVPALADAVLGQQLCVGAADYALAKRVACRRADVRVEIPEGFPYPAKVCNATSFGVGFEAIQGELAAVAERPKAGGPGCPPETDPSTDTCAEE